MDLNEEMKKDKWREMDRLLNACNNDLSDGFKKVQHRFPVKNAGLSAWIAAKNEAAGLYAPIHQPFYKRLWALLNRDI